VKRETRNVMGDARRALGDCETLGGASFF